MFINHIPVTNLTYTTHTQATGPPTVPTTYPFQSQSTPDLTNSLLIPFEMYMYYITCPLILIVSPTAILNLPINSFCSLDTALVLTSDNFLSIFPLSPPFSFLFLPLVTFMQNCHVVLSLLSLLINKDLCVQLYQLSFCVIFYFICVFHPETFLFFQ